MYSINYTHQFKKDMRKCAKRGLNIDAITQAIGILAATGTLPAEYKSHPSVPPDRNPFRSLRLVTLGDLFPHRQAFIELCSKFIVKR